MQRYILRTYFYPKGEEQMANPNPKMDPVARTEVKNKTWQMPDTYVIIFCIVVLAALLTYVVPTGHFDVLYEVTNGTGEQIAVIADGAVNEFEMNGDMYTVDASGDKTYVLLGEEEIGSIKKSKAKAVNYTNDFGASFKVVQVYGDYQTEGEKNGIKIFEKWGGVGFLNFAFEGFVSGSKWGSAVGVMAFILIVGGAFGIVLHTGAVENGILNLINKTQGREIAIIPIMFVLFSLGGAIFGMGEEAIPFAMILVPVMVAMGYDAITGIMITYVATQVGFATSWMNPFSVAIAQGIAGVAIGSGNGFRMAMWALFTIVGTLYTLQYARKIHKDPRKSVSYETDAYFRDDLKEKEDKKANFGLGHGLVLTTLVLGMAWLIWGVNAHEYYLPEIATIFFTIGIVSGIIGVVFKLENMTVNDIAISFRSGAKDLLGAAMVVGMAQGIVLVLGGTGAATDTVLNTVLNGMVGVLRGLPTMFVAWIMFVFQSIFNFFVVSGSGQAALTMPLMAPLAQLVGVSKQVAVLAFQLGDGFTNCIVPTSAALMGTLGVARVDWTQWLKFQLKFQGILVAGATITMLLAVMMGF